jgi:hypothetical protein
MNGVVVIGGALPFQKQLMPVQLAEICFVGKTRGEAKGR